MSNFTTKTQVPMEEKVVKIEDDLVSIPGKFRDADVIVTSGGGTTSGVSQAYVDSQDQWLKGYIDAEIASIELSGRSAVLGKIDALRATPADVVVSTSGAGDLAAAVSAVTSGQTIEIQSSATFGPITIPSGVEFNIKVADGYAPVLTGQEVIKISDGAADVIISSLILDTCTTSYQNGKGSGVAFATNHAKANDIIFHNITFRNCQGSGFLMAYYNGGDYATAPTLAQMSQNISLVGCHFHKATTDKIEGGSIGIRGVNGGLIYDCYIDAVNLGRGMHIQNCINTTVERNYVANCDDGNGGEGIKIDQLGTIVGYRNTAIIRDNVVKRCIEGIDIDDITSMSIVQNNVVSECSGEGISVDDSGRAVLINNHCFNNNRGIRLENGAIANLKKNVCYNNTTDYLIQNGYVLDDSNTTSLDDMFVTSHASITKNDSVTVTGSTVADALDVLGTPAAGVSGSRPGTPDIGEFYFDTTIDTPIWYGVSGWVDGSGNPV